MVANIPVKKPINKPVPVSILSFEDMDFLYNRIEITEATGTNKQQAMLLNPGIVVKTAAPNPQIKAGRYLLFIGSA
jgi:hypothetical protein